MKRWLAVLLGVVAIIAVASTLFSYLSDRPAELALVLVEVDGEVHITDGKGNAVAAQEGRSLVADERVATQQGRAVLGMGSETRISLGADTTLVAQQWSNQWSQAEGLDISQNLLQANPDVTIIFGQADGLALGAAQGVKVSGVEQRVYIGGFDGDTTALPILAEGGFDATATQQVRGIGRLAVDSAVKLAAGETLPAEQLLPGYLTTPENAGEYVAEHP